MAIELEDLRALKRAESIADDLWKVTLRWDNYARYVVGRQLARAADSVGANIAEAYGRFHYGEKIQFLYYARGSLFETKYWLNRAKQRNLLSEERAHQFAADLSNLARQLNAFVSHLKTQQRQSKKKANTISERPADYNTSTASDPLPFFTEEELSYLANPEPSNVPSQSPVSSPPVSNT